MMRGTIMPIAADFVIVGSGLTGATIARVLSDNGWQVLVLERRAQLGGNVHDSVHASGHRFHTFGPHYFRTAADRIWQFVNRFAAFYRYEAKIMAQIDGRFENWPVTRRYIERQPGPKTPHHPQGLRPAANFEAAMLEKMPMAVYRQFVHGYTLKQWAVPPETLAAELARRVVIRDGDDTRLSTHRYQGLPRDGYADFMKRMLGGIRCLTGVDYLTARDQFAARNRVVYTGAIDAFYGYDLGRLRYRSQRREHVFLHGELGYPCAQVNFPDPADARIRGIEWAHLMPPGERPEGTLLTYETPCTPGRDDEAEYPFPSEEDTKLYEEYRQRAEAVSGELFCGRLGEYRYLDMDQAIGRAMMHADFLMQQADVRGLRRRA
jgi:UDP-galactopyranose mutase